MATRYLRFADLVERRIVNNRTTLNRWIEDYGFPPGRLLGPNTRAWTTDEVDVWLEERPAQRDAERVAAEVKDREAEEARATKDSDEDEDEDEDEAA